jgi:hypothetical protein
MDKAPGQCQGDVETMYDDTRAIKVQDISH